MASDKPSDMLEGSDKPDDSLEELDENGIG